MPVRGPLCGTPSGSAEMVTGKRGFKGRQASLRAAFRPAGAALDLRAGLRHGGAP